MPSPWRTSVPLIFGGSYGITPGQFLTERRIDYAKALLATHMYSMRQIAAMSGFAEEKYFYATFKRVCGTTPTGWKQR
ncbi:MAG: helix-turn-helix domain-containing protein [Ruminococcaceae bacterium]|nr:helix-turn-helix domain-containing protein [Oscillospiraceae bacterium]